MKEIKEIDNKYYLEDALLTWRILDIINVSHSLYIKNVFRHCKIGGFEVDAVAVCETGEGMERWIGFELKENNIMKAFVQARLRKKYFDYFYIIINLPTKTIVDFLLQRKDLNGIGFVSAYDNIVVYKSRFKKRVEDRLSPNRKVKELTLIKFLHAVK